MPEVILSIPGIRFNPSLESDLFQLSQEIEDSLGGSNLVVVSGIPSSVSEISSEIFLPQCYLTPLIKIVDFLGDYQISGFKPFEASARTLEILLDSAPKSFSEIQVDGEWFREVEKVLNQVANDTLECSENRWGNRSDFTCLGKLIKQFFEATKVALNDVTEENEFVVRILTQKIVATNGLTSDYLKALFADQGFQALAEEDATALDFRFAEEVILPGLLCEDDSEETALSLLERNLVILYSAMDNAVNPKHSFDAAKERIDLALLALSGDDPEESFLRMQQRGASLLDLFAHMSHDMSLEDSGIPKSSAQAADNAIQALSPILEDLQNGKTFECPISEVTCFLNFPIIGLRSEVEKFITHCSSVTEQFVGIELENSGLLTENDVIESEMEREVVIQS